MVFISKQERTRYYSDWHLESFYVTAHNQLALKMPRGPPLTDLEKGQILAMHHQLMSLRDISKELGRSVGAVQRFLKNPSRTARSRAHVTGQKLTVRQEKAMIRKATTGNYSARDIKQDLSLPVGVRRIQQILSATPHLKYKK